VAPLYPEEIEMTAVEDKPTEATETTTGPWTVDEQSTIYERMMAVLAEMPSISKDHRNTSQNFNYRSHDDVMNALNPLLSFYGVFIVPNVLERVTAQRTTRNNSVMYEVNLHVEFTFYGAKGDKVVASAWGEGTDSGDKSTNKAMTMAFKNVIAVAFAISTDVTVDTDAGAPEETYPAGQAPGSPSPAAPAGGGQRVFDVAKDLLPGAIKVTGELTMNELRAAAAFLDPTIEPRVWLKIEDDARESIYGPMKEMTPTQWGEHFRRFANFVRGTQEKAAALGQDFADRALISDVLARAYNGFSSDLLVEATPDPPQDPEGAEKPAESRTDPETEAT
jgi:hypothetical protein